MRQEPPGAARAEKFNIFRVEDAPGAARSRQELIHSSFCEKGVRQEPPQEAPGADTFNFFENGKRQEPTGAPQEGPESSQS